MAERPDPWGADESIPEEDDDDSSDETEAAPRQPPAPQLPEDPFTTEPISFMQGGLLSILLRGGPVGKHFVPTGVAGGFLFRFDQLVRAIAARRAAKVVGRRGQLPLVPQAGLFGLSAVSWDASVVFQLSLAGDEQSTLTDAGDVTTITDDVLRDLEVLVTSAAAGDPESLWELTRLLGGRVGKNYERLLDVLIQQEVESVWRFRTEPRAIDLSATRASRAKTYLEYPELPVTTDEVMRGFLDRVAAREHGFMLDPEAEKEDNVTGTYAAHLQEDLRNAWGHEVEVRLRITHHFLRRQAEAQSVDYELIEVVEIFE